MSSPVAGLCSGRCRYPDLPPAGAIVLEVDAGDAIDCRGAMAVVEMKRKKKAVYGERSIDSL